MQHPSGDWIIAPKHALLQHDLCDSQYDLHDLRDSQYAPVQETGEKQMKTTMTNLSPGVSRAISMTGEWLKPREPWVVQDAVQSLLARIQNVAGRAYKASLKNNFPKKARRDFIRTIAYLPPDMRINLLLSMAHECGPALDEIVTEKYDARSEPARYNIYATLGSMARYQLLTDIFNDDRLQRVEEILNSQNGARQ